MLSYSIKKNWFCMLSLNKPPHAKLESDFFSCKIFEGARRWIENYTTDVDNSRKFKIQTKRASYSPPKGLWLKFVSLTKQRPLVLILKNNLAFA